MLRRKAQTWADNDTTKPLSAARMADLEQGIRNAQRSLTQLRTLRPNPVNQAVHPAPPTIAHSTANALVANKQINAWSGAFSFQNCVAVEPYAGALYPENRCNGANNTASWAVEFDHYGNDIVLKWVCTAYNPPTNASSFVIFVDDQPISASRITPTGITPVVGTVYYMRLTWGTVSQRRITMRMRDSSFLGVALPAAHSVTPTDRRRPKVACVGASFTWQYPYGAGSFDTLDAWPWQLQDMLGVEMFQCAVGATGYSTGAPPTYSTTARMDALVQVNPDLIIVEGSGNDDGVAAATLTSNAAAFYSACATRLPGVPIIVVGAQPNKHDVVNTAARLTNLNAVKAAADAAPNVLAFIDPVGSVPTLPAAYASGANYVVGDKVLYLGGFYQARAAVTTAAATLDSRLWTQVSWLTGTGYQGAPTADGNRDVFLADDGTHPSLAGERHIAVNIGREVRRVLDTL